MSVVFLETMAAPSEIWTLSKPVMVDSWEYKLLEIKKKEKITKTRKNKPENIGFFVLMLVSTTEYLLQK